MARGTTLPDVADAGPGRLLRAASAADVDALLPLYSQLHENDGEVDAVSFAAELEEIQRVGSRRVYLLVADDEVLGTMDLFVMRNLTRELRPWAGIENFVIERSRRRLGHGAAMLEAGVEIARSVGAYKVQLISSSKRDAAHHLYSTHLTAPVSGFRTYL